jgi:amino acid transporter
MATAIVVGTVIGSGVFKKPQVVAANVPQFGLAALVWVLGGVLAFMGALALSEVAVLYPKAGGNYVFLREGFGRLPGFLYGWVEFWINRAGSLAALATIFTESLFNILQPGQVDSSGVVDNYWLQRWLTVAIIMGLAVVNVLGVRWGGLLQLLITIVKIGSLLGIMALPFIASALAPPDITVPSPQPEHLQPLWPESWSRDLMSGIGTALLGVLWAYHGWMNVSLVAEEIKNPQKNLPLALLGGTLIIIFLYLGANLAYYLIIPANEIAGITETTVATVFTKRLLGPMGAALASGAVMCSVFGALNGNLLVGPRVLFAMSDDGLAPRRLASVHPRFRTPAWAILVLGGWASLLILAGGALDCYKLPVVTLGSWTINPNLKEGKPLFDVLTDFVLFGAVIFETMAVATIFAFRRKLPEVNRPYRCWGYPVVPALYVVILAVVLVSIFVNQRIEAMIGLGFIAVGVGVYFSIERTLR